MLKGGGGGEDMLLRRSASCPADRLKSNRFEKLFDVVITKGKIASFPTVIDIEG
jgi:hypothetical protein